MDAEMMETEASSQSQASSSGQNDAVRDLLTLARHLINQGKPSQALQAVIFFLFFFMKSFLTLLFQLLFCIKFSLLFLFTHSFHNLYFVFFFKK